MFFRRPMPTQKPPSSNQVRGSIPWLIVIGGDNPLVAACGIEPGFMKGSTFVDKYLIVEVHTPCSYLLASPAGKTRFIRVYK